MVGTFSVNIGQITEATSFPVQDYLSLTASSSSDLLHPLRDNDDKLVTPMSLRNSFLSLWSSIPFKETSISGFSYIGVDAINPNNKDLKRTIFIGKRSFSATQSYSNSHDIMNSVLLSGDTDIFFYNTKLDTVSNTTTRISILSGSNKSLYPSAPYIQSQRVSGITQSLSLDIVSRSGDLTIGNDITQPSSYGTFSLNGLTIPTIIESSASASNNKVWMWNDGRIIWDELKLPVLNTIGTTGSQLDIFGSPVSVNDYSLELTDDRKCPTTIGGITMGSSFENVAISEVLRSLIYTYLPPTCTISIDNKYAEVGTYPTPILTYTINKRSRNTIPTGLTNMIPGIYPAIVNDNPITITGTSTGIVISPIGLTQTSFTITVSDNTTTSTATTSIEGIYPYFYGFSTLTTITNNELNNLAKLVDGKSNKIIDISGSGNYYFIYDSSYGLLSGIFDTDGNNIINSFTYSFRTLSKFPWATKEFIVYQWNNVSQIGPPSINYEFKY